MVWVNWEQFYRVQINCERKCKIQVYKRRIIYSNQTSVDEETITATFCTAVKLSVQESALTGSSLTDKQANINAKTTNAQQTECDKAGGNG